MATKRQQKYARMIQKELAGIFQLKSRNWISNNIVSITKVEISPDLSVASAYLSFLQLDNKQQIMDNLDHHKGEIRKDLGNRIGKTVRKIPELVFYLDEGAEHAEKMDNIFKNLHIPPETAEDE